MRSVPQSVTAALCPRFGADSTCLEFLGGGQDWSDGTLYTYRSRDAPGTEMVIKILAFPIVDAAALERAEDRVRHVRYFAERGSRIIAPEPSLEGRLFETEEVDGTVYLAYAYRKVAGRSARTGDPCVRSGAFYRAMGGVLGRLHAVAHERQDPLDSEGGCSAFPSLKGWREEGAFFRAWCRDDEVGAAWERLLDALGRLRVDASCYGFVHNDAHAGNLLFDPASRSARSGSEPDLVLIDFDVANYQWFMCDAATALYSFLIMASGGIEGPRAMPEGFRQWAFGLFWQGYGRHREVRPEWLESLDLFLQYRRCLLFMPFQDVTARDPAWRRRWKEQIAREDARLFGT